MMHDAAFVPAAQNFLGHAALKGNFSICQTLLRR